MRPILATVGPLATAAANNIALSQTPAAAGDLTLNGSLVNALGVAVLDTARRVLVSTSDTTHAFTVTGTSPTGTLLSEVVGPVTTSGYTQQDFKTVTSVSINGAATAAVTVGTNGVASTPWVRLDEWADAPVGIQCDVVGTVSYTVQSSYDDPNGFASMAASGPPPAAPVTPAGMTWINSSDTSAVNATTAIQTEYAYAPLWVRALLNSGSGSVSMTVTQYNAANL